MREKEDDAATLRACETTVKSPITISKFPAPLDTRWASRGHGWAQIPASSPHAAELSSAQGRAASRAPQRPQAATPTSIAESKNPAAVPDPHSKGPEAPHPARNHRSTATPGKGSEPFSPTGRRASTQLTPGAESRRRPAGRWPPRYALVKGLRLRFHAVKEIFPPWLLIARHR